MNRRETIALLGGAAAWPVAARAQQPALPVIGYLGSGSLESRRDWVAEFHRGLNETGYVEGRNVTIECRWAEGQENRLPSLAADLVRRRVTVIAAMGAPTVPPAKAATTTIPIVFSTGTDPVQDGFVPSLNRPGGNVTGVTVFTSALGPKRLELLHEMVPKTAVIGFLVDQKFSDVEAQSRAAQDAAPALGLQLHVLSASSERDLDTAFATIVKQRVGALMVGNASFFLSRPEQLVALSARHAVPTIYAAREFVTAGGLISYGNSTAESYRHAGVYTGRILKGEEPADLPVIQPTKFELVVNLKTAKAIGLAIPESFLLRADEVIE